MNARVEGGCGAAGNRSAGYCVKRIIENTKPHSQIAGRTLRVALAAATALLAGLLANSGPEPWLAEQKLTVSSEDYMQRIFAAPVVIVGTVLSDAFVRGPVASRWTGSPLQLRKIRVRVENILRGERVPSTATVYYFTWAGGFDGPRPLGFWHADGFRRDSLPRRIFWLRRDSGVLRTACDGWDSCTLPVHSGSHPDYKPNPNLPLGYALGDILLTRGQGAGDAEFAAHIKAGVPSTVPEGYMFDKLRYLAATQSPAIRAAACDLLAAYQHPCAPNAAPGAVSFSSR